MSTFGPPLLGLLSSFYPYYCTFNETGSAGCIWVVFVLWCQQVIRVAVDYAMLAARDKAHLGRGLLLAPAIT